MGLKTVGEVNDLHAELEAVRLSKLKPSEKVAEMRRLLYPDEVKGK